MNGLNCGTNTFWGFNRNEIVCFFEKRVLRVVGSAKLVARNRKGKIEEDMKNEKIHRMKAKYLPPQEHLPMIHSKRTQIMLYSHHNIDNNNLYRNHL